MNYPEYENDLYEIYKAEVMGEALFSTAAVLTLSANKSKWRCLAALEIQTKNKYLEFVRAQGDEPKFPLGAKLAGHVFGSAFALLPWSLAMKMLKSGTPPLIEVFGRLEKHAPESENPFFSYVLQHELAIDQFAGGELAGDENAVAVIANLLN